MGLWLLGASGYVVFGTWWGRSHSVQFTYPVNGYCHHKTNAKKPTIILQHHSVRFMRPECALEHQSLIHLNVLLVSLMQPSHRGRRRTHWVHGWGFPKWDPLPRWRVESCIWTIYWCGEISKSTCKCTTVDWFRTDIVFVFIFVWQTLISIDVQRLKLCVNMFHVTPSPHLSDKTDQTFTANWDFVLFRMGRRAATLQSLIVLQVGFGRTVGL